MMMPSILSAPALALALLLPTLHVALVEGNAIDKFGVPGTSHTIRGYDTEGGDEPVCWRSRSDLAALASSGTDGAGNGDSDGDSDLQRQRSLDAIRVTPWDNKLYKSFILTGDVDLLPTCPQGLSIEGDLPADVEMVQNDYMLRTGMFHDYPIRFSINLDNMGGEYVFSDEGARIAVQVLLCQVDQGLCTPFVHEHANDRLKAANITEVRTTGDRHGGTHVHSPTVFVDLPDPSASGLQEFELSIPIRVNAPGTFFAIAAYQLFTADGDSIQQYRYDVSNALSTRIVTYQDPAVVLTVTKGMQIVVAILIALAVAVLACILFLTIKYRETRVMKLSQAPFLVVSRIAAIAATFCTFLFNPKTDLHCRLRDPLVLIPLQFMYAIMIGRLWRIGVVVSPLLTITEKDKNSTSPKHWSSMACRKFFEGLTKVSTIGEGISFRRNANRQPQSVSRGPLRSTVTNLQLSKIVLLFTIPQIVIQILALVLQPSELTVSYNLELSMGHVTCSPQDTKSGSLSMWGWYILLLFFLLILFLAYESRTLPSLFNETPEIYNSVLTSIIVIAVGLATIRLSESPTTSPDVAYLIRVLIVITMTLNVSLRIMLPKILLARSGKPILINKLVTDHRVSQAQSSISSYGGSTSRISALSNNSQNESSRFSTSEVSKDSLSKDEFANGCQDLEAASANAANDSEDANDSNVEAADDSPHVRFADEEAGGPPPAASPDDCTNKACSRQKSKDSVSRDEFADESPDLEAASPNECTDDAADATQHVGVANGKAGFPPAPVLKRNTSFTGKHRRHPSSSGRKIRIDDDHAPNRKLTLKMIGMQKALSDANHEINSGYAISHEDWSNLRDACVELGTVFRDGVEFAWERENEKNKE